MNLTTKPLNFSTKVNRSIIKQSPKKMTRNKMLRIINLKKKLEINKLKVKELKNRTK